MTNLAGKAYGMTVLTPMPPRKTWITRLVFMVVRAFPNALAPLLGLGLIHFARWVLIRRDQWPDLGQPKSDLNHDFMLFGSNFNGTWEQYVDAFSDSLPSDVSLIWYTALRFPLTIPVSDFSAYIRANQIDTNYYYNATPGNGQREIKLALKLEHDLAAVEGRMDDMSDEELGEAYDTLFAGNQSALASPGYGPIPDPASLQANISRGRAGYGQTVAPEREAQPVPPSTVRASSANAEASEHAKVTAAVNAALGTASRKDEAPPLENADREREAHDA